MVNQGKDILSPTSEKTKPNQSWRGRRGLWYNCFIISPTFIGSLRNWKKFELLTPSLGSTRLVSIPLLYPPLSQSPRGAILMQSRAQKDPMHQILKIPSESHRKPPSRFVAFVAHHSLGALLPGLPFALFPPVLEPAVGTICPNCLRLSQPFRSHVHSWCCVSECLGSGSTPRVRLAVASLWPRSSWRTLIGFCLASCHPDQGTGTLFSQMDLDLSKMVN